MSAFRYVEIMCDDCEALAMGCAEYEQEPWATAVEARALLALRGWVFSSKRVRRDYCPPCARAREARRG